MINAVTTDTTAAAAAMKKSAGMNKDDFLKLFVTQLQNQDPLKPQDSSEFITQLAQLTGVEQAYNTNTNLQNLMSAMNGSTNMSAVSFIGKDVVANGSTVNLTSGSQPVLGYRLAGSASSVAIKIQDVSGATVRTLTAGVSPSGDSKITWDGKDAYGRQLPAGTYSYSVTATDGAGKSFAGTPLVVGRVDGVKLDGQSPVVTVGGIDVALSDVLSVKGVM